MASRIHPHSPLPAPALHSTLVSNQSKSHVLAGVQDAYWSDDEADDAECPLCLEEFDISDLNFKPCPCGYQICRFCWHHIKENLNGRCPACRREYTDEAVQFKPINKEDHKRLTQQKKQRERERKELEALNRKHLANVRVVQRNVVYVVGLGPRFAKEELIPTLRSNEYFGQYGKISKIVIVKRTPPGGRGPVVGLYITYHRREDAARCISAIDGANSPGGGGEVMRASYGTTKYCMTFLRGASCTDHSCMNLHEWGDETDCFTKEDLTTLKHTMKDTETRTRITTVRKGDESEGLPRAASWANKPRETLASTALHNNTSTSHSSTSSSAPGRPIKRPIVSTTTRTGRPGSSTGALAELKLTTVRKKEKEKTPSIASSSRPATPASATLPNRPVTPASTKPSKSKETPPVPPPVTQSPALSTAVTSDIGSRTQESSPAPSPPQTKAVKPTPEPVTTAPPAVPPGIPAAPPGLPPPSALPASPASSAPPPGLTPPPGLPPPSRQLPQLTAQSHSQSSYQISAQAQQLLEDVRARRESAFFTTPLSQNPFPDFDRMLKNLTDGDNGFSFNLDPKLAGNDDAEASFSAEAEAEANKPFIGTFVDAFPALRQSGYTSSFATAPPPGLGQVPSHPVYKTAPQPERQSSGSSYTGSFNPFAESPDDAPAAPTRRFSPLDDERKMSRFGFARGRQGSSSSPLATASPLSHSESIASSFYTATSTNDVSHSASQNFNQWGLGNRHHTSQVDYIHSNAASTMSSPLVPQAQANSMYQNHQHHQQQLQQQQELHQQLQQHQQQQAQASRFQPFEASVSEAQLRDFISQSRDRIAPTSRVNDGQRYRYYAGQPFSDPAIMSAQMASSSMMAQQTQGHDNGFVNSQAMDHLAFGPPPGLAYPPGLTTGPGMQGQPGGRGYDLSQTTGSAHVSASTSAVPSPALSSSDFPALPETTSTSTTHLNAEKQQSNEPIAALDDSSTTATSATTALDAKQQAKAERKAAKQAAYAERAAERQRLAQEKAAAKAVEKERIALERAAEKERLAKEKAEKEVIAKEKAEEERVERERLAAERAVRDKEARAKAEADKERLEKERAEKTKKEQEARARAPKVQASTSAGSIASAVATQAKGRKNQKPTTSASPPEPEVQAPILAKMPKKNKPNTKPIKIPREDHAADRSALASAATSDAPQLPEANTVETRSNSNDSRAQSMDIQPHSGPSSLIDLFCDIDLQVPWMDLPHHVIFDATKINPTPKMPLEYAPLVHALSALSVGGGSFANNMPSGSIDNAVSSFQQLLETLTQTISDLLRLLPRATWDDSSSFDGVLRDMLKGDDFLDDGGDDQNQQGKEDEVAALTMALERRARWMEVQLSKLEELHRDINTAAVRAVFSFNDNGWDRRGVSHKQGNSLARFDQLGLIEEDGVMRAMIGDELEEKLVVAKEAAVFAEAELKESMERVQDARPLAEDEW
ncbi:hypothetical protein QCA50_007762 [Cerrena zonata]|uniref:RING-type domain-containing protein n=1 Tax=Cerrena zonata TaxID=2478898 RepID=A0AAW0GI06_9APHY